MVNQYSFPSLITAGIFCSIDGNAYVVDKNHTDTNHGIKEVNSSAVKENKYFSCPSLINKFYAIYAKTEGIKVRMNKKTE